MNGEPVSIVVAGRLSRQFVKAGGRGVPIGNVESRINQLIQSIELERIALCVELGRIRVERLYRQLGCPDFASYLALERIRIAYKTAMSYALIGSVMITYEQELRAAGYDPVRDGISKLRLIATLVEKPGISRQEVFKALVSMSYRGLMRYLATGAGPVPSVEQPEKVKLRVDEEGVFLDCGSGCTEVVWLVPQAFVSEVAYRSFVSDITAVCRKHVTSLKTTSGLEKM